MWVGRQIPENLRYVGGMLNLSVEAISDITEFKAGAEDLLAVIVSAAGQDVQKAQGRLLRLLTTHVQDFGVLLGVAAPDLSAAYSLQSAVQQKMPVQVLAINSEPKINEPSDFARVLTTHLAEQPAVAKVTLSLPGHIKDDYDSTRVEDYDTDMILLQRAFNEFSRVTLTSQKGGRSKDCNVWKIEACRDSQECEPFVAKAGRLVDLQTEFDIYRAFVRDYVPFPFRAPVLEAKFIKGATRALIVSAFVGRSQRLDEYLATASNPELVMVSLFEGALRKWRRAVSPLHVSLGYFYVDQQREALKLNPKDALAKSLLPDPKRLSSSFDNARKKTASLPSPSELWEKLENEPKIDYYICRAHGDLNVRNVFVRWNSIDTILIDFSHSGVRESLARDPAKLETSIALNVADKTGRRLSHAALRKLYKGHLLPPREFPITDGRTDAIYQIRRLAGGEGITTYEYEMLTICHLLRFASEPQNLADDKPQMQKRRALSYSLACGLLDNLKPSGQQQ